LALRAVVFDYGQVLTGKPDPVAHAAMVRITGLTEERFEQCYWADRPAYDEGKLNGITFWQKLVRDAGLDHSLGDAEIEELNRWDAHHWTVQNPAMVAWQQQLQQRGLLTAILSNMGDAVHENIAREFAWIHRFDVQIWSYQLGIAKPDAAIYRHMLKLLGIAAEESLFLDDKQVNIDAAHALGMQALLFSTVDKLRADLIAAGMEHELPLPAC
jgi:putative hydrolase of the HAD superfamily